MRTEERGEEREERKEERGERRAEREERERRGDGEERKGEERGDRREEIGRERRENREDKEERREERREDDPGPNFRRLMSRGRGGGVFSLRCTCHVSAYGFVDPISGFSGPKPAPANPQA